MAMHPTWSEWFTNHPSNDAGNLNLQAFSNILGSGDTEATKLQQVTEEIDTVILAANGSNGIIMLHSPKNFGGTRTRPANKLVCMIGMGSQAVSVLVDLNLEFGTHKSQHYRAHRSQTFGIYNSPRSQKHPSTNRRSNWF